MKKAVLVVDHKDRDLRGILLIAFWLNKKYNVFPYITHTKNEISCLIKHRPELMLIQHIRWKHQEMFLEFARRQNTCIALCLAEGLPADYPDTDILFLMGKNDYMHYVNVFLTWGRHMYELVKNKELLKHAFIQPVGSPRFDYHTPHYSALYTPKSVFCKTLGIDASKPIILWMTNFQFCYFGDIDEYIKKFKDPNYSGHRRALTIREMATSHKQAFHTLCDCFLKLIQEFPELQYIIKVHPAESLAIYQETFSHFKNVVLFQSLHNVTLSDTIRHADIQITWRCTTSPEAWLMDLQKKVISVEPPEVKSERNKFLTVGNDVVSDYASLKEKVINYLKGGKVSQEIINRRLEFIHNHLYANDGCSSERCADILYKNLHEVKPKRTLYNYKVILKLLKSYRFNKNWLYLKRDETHPKYINPDEIHIEMNKLMDLFKHKVAYKVEM